MNIFCKCLSLSQWEHAKDILHIFVQQFFSYKISSLFSRKNKSIQRVIPGKWNKNKLYMSSKVHLLEVFVQIVVSNFWECLDATKIAMSNQEVST